MEFSWNTTQSLYHAVELQEITEGIMFHQRYDEQAILTLSRCSSRLGGFRRNEGGHPLDSLVRPKYFNATDIVIP